MVSLSPAKLVINPSPIFISNPTPQNPFFFFFPICSPNSPFFKSKFSSSISCLPKATNVTTSSTHQEEEEEEEFQVLSAVRSKYNDIVIVDTPNSRMLLLDSTHNVHSILNKGLQKWTGSYWDEFASLPAIVPKGPIAIYGLGGGTAAHLMLDLWPSLQLEGWEIDDILIDKARDYFGLSDLEKHSQGGGILDVRVGDVLSPSENVSGKYAGIIIDLFSEGKVLAELQEVETWLQLNNRLLPDGRFMVNCGGIGRESDETDHQKSMDDAWIQNSTIQTLMEAFPGKVSWKRMPERNGENFLALTGPLPDLTIWSSSVPGPLSENVKQWKLCESSS
ncbi:hypothetical protein EZV62_027724 [Acer yangbiense]|uniref:PABS domain-containing protein n=1 Tax=Acer yangbiense TaxID=1000413 RepID=A0A5C7GUY4_9ROSI|nr:hypothetical protein EZV62_027724 [Acer yangbiense]